MNINSPTSPLASSIMPFTPTGTWQQRIAPTLVDIESPQQQLRALVHALGTEPLQNQPLNQEYLNLLARYSTALANSLSPTPEMVNNLAKAMQAYMPKGTQDHETERAAEQFLQHKVNQLHASAAYVQQNPQEALQLIATMLGQSAALQPPQSVRSSYLPEDSAIQDAIVHALCPTNNQPLADITGIQMGRQMPDAATVLQIFTHRWLQDQEASYSFSRDRIKSSTAQVAR